MFLKINKFSVALLTVFLFFFLTSFVFATTLDNPLGNSNVDPRLIVGNIIRAILGIVGSLALGVFILGGFFWVISAGNEEKIKKGKDMVMWAAFGLALIFFSYAIVSFVINAVVGGGSSGGTTQGFPGGTKYDII